MSEKLNPKVVSFSLLVVSVIISLLCAVFIAAAPEASLKFFGSIFHGIDITKIATSVTLSGVLAGLIAIAVIALVTGWLFAAIYNFFVDNIK